jgi:hypothetical protein
MASGSERQRELAPGERQARHVEHRRGGVADVDHRLAALARRGSDRGEVGDGLPISICPQAMPCSRPLRGSVFVRLVIASFDAV